MVTPTYDVKIIDFETAEYTYDRLNKLLNGEVNRLLYYDDLLNRNYIVEYVFESLRLI